MGIDICDINIEYAEDGKVKMFIQSISWKMEVKKN